MTRALKPEELRAICDPATLPFESTAELPPLDGMIGQDRAVSATAFGIGMRRAGYNLFVVGAARTGRTSTMHRVLTRTAQEERTPSDYCYVYNFADPYRPAALELPAGRAREFATEMARLVQECRTRLPRAFEGEEFERHKARIVDELGHRQQSEMVALETAARDVGFVALKTPASAPEGNLAHHATRGDFSRWVLDVFGDRTLGHQMRKLEARWTRGEIRDLRGRLRELVAFRYGDDG